MSVRNVQILIIVAGLLGAASWPSSVHADPVASYHEDLEQLLCGAVSPLFLTLGDAYFDVADSGESAMMSQEDISQNELLAHLGARHFSQGSGVRVFCIGSPEQLRAQWHSVSLEDIEGRQSQYPDTESEISITAYEYDNPSRHLVRETVTIPTRSQNVIHLGGRNLETSRRHRKPTRKGSYLEETRINASLNDNTITIDQSVYVNGSLAQWHSWTLSD